MTEKILLKQVRLLDPVSQTDRVTDVFIADGKIQAILDDLSNLGEDIFILDAQGLILGPGLVDLYSHSGEPGYEERETITSLLAAAASGGFTRVNILPDTIPPLDKPAVLTSLQLKNQLDSLPSLQFWGALTIGVKGQQMTELAELAPSVIGFADGQPIENLGLLRRILEYLNPLKKTVALVPSICDLKGNGVMREGSDSIKFGLPGNPFITESSAIAILLELALSTNTFIHIMRVSTRRGVELIAEAKKQGALVTASTTWMHLLLDTEAIASYDPCLRLEPPLGTPDDKNALIEGIKQGIIDAIAVDHTPYTYEEKTLAFAEAPPGVIGLELALPLLWHRFVATQELSALDLWKLLSVNPLLCLGQQPNSCILGQPAELTLFNPQQNWTVDRHNLKSLSSNTPWFGREITGKVVRIILPNSQ